MVFDRSLIALAVLLVACVQGPERVDVSGTPGDLRFVAVAADGADQVCADALSVTAVVPEDADPLWQVSSLGTGKCFHSLRYGELTADITQKAPATPLRSDMTYRVRISGPGFSAVRDFRLTPQGVTVQD
ncbi:hypothetical protein [Sphingomonas mucosissima]|uniref:Lipoprotein n=1 Tax=Sphingomonas mucosissima TaxID=370959 RepID=A0A245ZL79_9SPHN|nr:hypothetical protein [Sphingomonas mucosissima]OWK30494.1 hypothetical protein SPMU_14810 [Sphingomonas mucosissima]